MKKIVLTGANGFLGSTITAQAMDSGQMLTPLVRRGSKIDLLPADAKVEYVNYSNESDLSSALKGHHTLIHNAGLTRAVTWQKYQQVNVDLTARLIDIFNSSPTLDQFIFISSQAAAGPSLNGIPLTEDIPEKPVSMYGKSKLMAEQLIRKRVQGHWTIIRPASVFGPGDKDFLQIFRLVKKHFMFYPVSKEKTFSMIFSEELARMILLAVANKNAFSQTFFAADPEPVDQVQLTGYLTKIMSSSVHQIVIPEFLLSIISNIFQIYSNISGKLTVINKERMQEFKLSNWQINPGKSEQMLDFKIKHNLYEALKQTWLWYTEKGWLS